jgi:polysaccharide export outer membrane protein
MKLAQFRIGLLLLPIVLGVFALAQEPATADATSTTSSATTQTPGTAGTSGTIPGPIMGPLSPGDLIDYSVYGVQEMTQRTRIDGSGNVYLPLLGNVPLAGLTTEQAQKKLEDLLVSGGFLRNPHVTVSVAEYANGISLLGEVVRPGIYPVAGPRRLYDVLAAAGGLTPNAGNKITIAPKDSSRASEVVRITRDPSKSARENVLVNPGDTVIISKADVVYVVGEVVNPSGFMLDGAEPLTVLQVIAMAHGTNHDAKLDKTRIIRKTDKGRVEIPVALSKIMSAKAKDIPLQADDIVFVPSSTAKSAARRTIDTAISLATGVTLIHASRP